MKKRKKHVKPKKVKRAPPKPRRARKRPSKVQRRKPVRRTKTTRRVPKRAKRAKTKPVKKTRHRRIKRPSKAKRKAQNLKRRVRRDKARVFGTTVKDRRRREPKEMPKSIVQPDVGEVAFEEQLIEEQEQPEGAFAWTNEDEFIAQMERLGFSEREAYTLWFS